MLYDRLLVSVRQVRTDLERSDGTPNSEMCHNELLRAQRIIEELRFGLDDERGGDIAVSLRQIYDYCHDLLVAANMSKTADGLEDVDRLISEIREVWFEQVDRGPVLAGS